MTEFDPFEVPDSGQPGSGEFLPAYGHTPAVGPDTALAKNGQTVALASVGKRAQDFLLTILLVIVTLVIGYFIWTLIEWQHGRSPAKRILGLRVVNQSDGQTATWGKMFVRSFLVGGVLSYALNTVTLSIYGLVDIFIVFNKDHTRLTDKIAGTYVAVAA